MLLGNPPDVRVPAPLTPDQRLDDREAAFGFGKIIGRQAVEAACSFAFRSFPSLDSFETATTCFSLVTATSTSTEDAVTASRTVQVLPRQATIAPGLKLNGSVMDALPRGGGAGSP